MSKKKPPRKKYYIQPEDLRVEIDEFQKSIEYDADGNITKPGVASERLGEMLIQIATGLAASSRFDRRTYRDDMASDAVLRMYKNLHLIDLEHPKCNPFSYLTQVAYRVYLGRSDKENKKDRALDQYKEECYSEFEAAECISSRSPREGDMDMGFDYYGDNVKEPKEK
jgi:hypothetical protein